MTGNYAKDECAFTHYETQDYFHKNSASALFNKWLKLRVPEHWVVHCFRQTMRDRLRSVNYPIKMIDTLGGRSNQKIGHQYGFGYQFSAILKYMSKLIDNYV